MLHINIPGKKIPKSRLSRLSKFGGLAASVVGNMLVDGAKEFSKGSRPQAKNLLLTPSNIEQVAKKLSHLRGAAMKLGQMISMDAGELLSPELSALLARLRSDASPMLHSELVKILKRHWGDNWVNNFSQFDLRPFAAASIGQVHLAHLDNGQKLAVKIQYPGVRESIASDIDNVATLLKVSGLLPSHIDIKTLLEEAKTQLQNEADYTLEANYIDEYRSHLNSEKFELPVVHEPLSNDSILAMQFIDGYSIDEAVDLSQQERNDIVSSLIELFLQELFEFGLMQTDPNFANFLYQPDSAKIGLLDFGATRAIPEHISSGYRLLIKAGLENDTQAMLVAAKQIGFFSDNISDEYLQDMLAIFDVACEPLRQNEPYDFAKSQLASRVRDLGLKVKQHKSQWHTPPVDAIFIHRKLGGLYLLASKLKANIDVRSLFDAYR